LLVDGNDEISFLESRAGFILDGHFCYFLMNKKNESFVFSSVGFERRGE